MSQPRSVCRFSPALAALCVVLSTTSAALAAQAMPAICSLSWGYSISVAQPNVVATQPQHAGLPQRAGIARRATSTTVVHSLACAVAAGQPLAAGWAPAVASIHSESLHCGLHEAAVRSGCVPRQSLN